MLMTGLDSDLLPHERADEELLVPLVARAFGGAAATAALSRTHAEIEHQDGPASAAARRTRRRRRSQPEDVIELRRLLYGLYGVLRLHNAQEEEGAFSLIPAAGVSAHTEPG